MLVCVRLQRPHLQSARLSVAVVIGFVLGAVFCDKARSREFTENDMRLASVIFLTFIIMGILALSVLPVMTMIPRHVLASSSSRWNNDESTLLSWALGVAERWFYSDVGRVHGGISQRIRDD
jgi:hypothetical protein